MSAGKIITLIFGIFFLILGITITFSGIAIYAVSNIYTDSDGYFTAPEFQVTQPNSVAITITNINITIKNAGQFDLGNIVKIRFALSNASYFVGIAETSKVDKYLENVTYSVVDKVDWVNGITYRNPVNPTKTANLSANPPLNQADFSWAAKAVGGTTLEWAPKSGIWTIVIMKVDGSKNIDVGIKAGARVPILGPISLFLVILGLMFFVLAIVMFIVIAKSNKTKFVQVNQYHPSIPVRVAEYPTPLYPQPPIYGAPSPKAQASTQPPSQQASVAPGNEEVFVVAEWGPRILAFIIDAIVVSLFLDVLRLPVLFGDPSSVVLYPSGISINGIGLFIYFILLESNYGTTIGKEALKLQVITEDGRKPELKEAALSALGKAFFLPIDLIVGLLIKDTEHEIPLSQRLMQKVSKTLVIVKPIKQIPSQYNQNQP